MDKDKCHSCKREFNNDVIAVRWIIDAFDSLKTYCRQCVHVSASGVIDVWYGYGTGVQVEENIADPKTGEPIPFWDKASKKAAMKKAGVMEAGDKYHGARNDDMTPQKRSKKYFV